MSGTNGFFIQIEGFYTPDNLQKTFKVIKSMSGTANCFDNTVADALFHTLKTELICHDVSDWNGS